MKKIIKTKNRELIKWYLLLDAVDDAKGRRARAISKFKKLVYPIIEDYEKEQSDLYEQYGREMDSEEEQHYEKELIELQEEAVIIDLTTFEPFIPHLASALDEWDKALKGMDADVYDELLDILEEIIEESEEEEDGK